MSVFYVSLLVLLGLVQAVLRLRVNRLEKRYVGIATEAHALLSKGNTRRGNSNSTDPLTAARTQFELAQLGMKRDRAEARYLAGQSLCDKFARTRSRLAGYRGKLLPYVVGVLDVTGVILFLDRNGFSVELLKNLLGLST